MKNPIYITMIEFLANEGNLLEKQLFRLDEPFGLSNLGIPQEILFDESSGEICAILLQEGIKETHLEDLYVQVDSIPVYK